MTMTENTKDLQFIEEAVARGITPGVICKSPGGTIWTVTYFSNWKKEEFKDQVNWRDTGITNTYGFNPYILEDQIWATVVNKPTDTPSLDAEMACEPDDAMRTVIVNKAIELGWTEGKIRDGYTSKILMWSPYGSDIRLKHSSQSHEYKMISQGEFYDRLCNTGPREKPITIDGDPVKFFKDGSIMWRNIPMRFETIDRIHQRAQSNRS